ncbi:uncharacterized protein LOC122999612 [Thunnus albacares]|uniref:uncharacterized protein LOC122999612 n=1 Tax=Thunnus albacares TaxID=8236 RepID=UPI001CF6F227|nr:uncharacterized protein LOC122999612 [Thunnus albacares]XP_044232590.1 uncharacterized protein LOC122999612 [Thunnus albacares]XP_044232591.1 uncharacterized protein LOC122999612 [Thunnus albacares]XP_044232592.1 uncharacterized protein LOC122999612 [Thunnus albacares]
MDKITQEDISPQSVREILSPLSSKRPRTDCTNSGKSRFDIPELLTFRKTVGSPSSTSTSQRSSDLIHAAEYGDMQDEKPHEQQQDAKLNVTPITKVSSSHTNNRHTGSFAERHFLHLEKDEQPSVTETDKLSSYPADDAGGVLAESHSPKDSSADTSSHPDCRQLGKSLEDEPPGGCSLPFGNDEDGRQVQNSVNQIQAVAFSSSDEEVRCQSDYTYEDVRHDVGCDTWSQSAEVEESNQKGDEQGFSENIFFSKKEEEGKSHMSSSDYGDSKSFCCNPEEDPIGNLTEGGKNYLKKSELQIRENENGAVCDGETKEQVNENSMSKNLISSAASIEGSVVSYDVALARNIAIESASLEVDDFCGANEEHAAGEMIAKAWSETVDHTTETPMPARIIQEPAEGDNDAGFLSVIDPALWSETDRQAAEKCCNSESTAGVELSQSIRVCEMETPLPLCSYVRPLQKISTSDQAGQFYNQSRTQQGKDEKENLRQSYAEPQSYSFTTYETHSMHGDEGSCRWESSPSSSPHRPAKPLPAGDERQESYGTVGHQLKEQDQSGCFSVSLDPLKTQKVEYSQTGIVRMNETTVFKEREESFGEEEVITDQLGNSAGGIEPEEKPSQQNDVKEDTIKISAVVTDWTEGEISTRGNKLTLSEDELGKRLECLSDHPYSADISLMERTTQEKESVEGEMKTDDYSEVSVKSEDDLLHQNEHEADVTEISPDECISDETEGNKLTLGSEDEEGNKCNHLSEYQLKTEIFTIEHKDDIFGFSFPPTSDAVVPNPHDLSQRCHSKITDNYPTALNYNDRFSPVPSALYDCVPGGFDTFEKIQLSPDDDDDDHTGLGNSPLLTSLPGQLLKTPQRQVYYSMPVAESDEHGEIPEEEEEEDGEEEVEGYECHTEKMANGYLNSDTNCNELANFISAADIMAVGWPEQQPNCESVNPSSMSSTVPPGSDSPASDMNEPPEFEMKKQFDMVLKELKLFFDISTSDFAGDGRESSPERCGDITEASEGDACKEHLNSPELGRHRDTSSNDADEDHSLEMCGGDPVVSCIVGSHDGEQEVPFGSHLCQEASVYTAEKHREPRETEQRRTMWSPSSLGPPFLEQLSHRQAGQARRLEPLRTCTRPIRVGLSKKARTKHLHRPHPYK